MAAVKIVQSEPEPNLTAGAGSTPTAAPTPGSGGGAGAGAGAGGYSAGSSQLAGQLHTPGQGQAAQEYVETVAHELRTPLQTASGFLAFILQGMAGPVTAMQRDMLASLGTSLEQAQSLVEDLLCLSQLESGRFSLLSEPVDLKKIVTDTVANLRVMAEAAGVSLVVEEGAPPGKGKERGRGAHQPAFVVEGAANRLAQCLRNLLTNALKFSPDGGTVWIRLEETGQNYLVRVIDQGPGIKPEHLVALFERHYQVQDAAAVRSSDARHLSGYGLGLSITKELIERQGGQVGVESTYGKGSCFWFSLPKGAEH